METIHQQILQFFEAARPREFSNAYSTDSLHGDEHLQPEFTGAEYRQALSDIEDDVIAGKIDAADFLENDWPDACQMLINATHGSEAQKLTAYEWVSAQIAAYAERHVDDRMAANRRRAADDAMEEA